MTILPDLTFPHVPHSSIFVDKNSSCAQGAGASGEAQEELVRSTSTASFIGESLSSIVMVFISTSSTFKRSSSRICITRGANRGCARTNLSYLSNFSSSFLLLVVPWNLLVIRRSTVSVYILSCNDVMGSEEDIESDDAMGSAEHIESDTLS